MAASGEAIAVSIISGSSLPSFLRFQDPGPQSLPSCPLSGDEISGQDPVTLSSSGMPADPSRPAACRAGPELCLTLPIPTPS